MRIGAVQISPRMIVSVASNTAHQDAAKRTWKQDMIDFANREIFVELKSLSMSLISEFKANTCISLNYT